MAGYVTLHAPFLLEEEIAKLRDRPSKIINNRIQNSLSEIIIKQTCSYMLGGIPYVAVASDNSALTTNFGNKVFTRDLPVDSRTGLISPHDWKPQAYRAFYSELLLEVNYQIPKDKKLTTYLVASPAVYVIARGREIVDYSEALKYQLSVWKSENQRSNWTTEDFFGSNFIQGDIIRLEDNNEGSEAGDLILTLDSSGTSYKGEVLGAFGPDDPPSGLYKIAMFPLDSDIVIPTIALGYNDRPANLRKEGGSTTSTSTSVGGTPAPKITSKTASGPLQGTAQPNWTVVITFPEDIVRVVTADSRGVWTCDYPRPYTTLELAEISATQQETSELGLTQTTTTDAIIQRSYGLPILDFVGNNPYTSTVVNLAQSSETTSLRNRTLTILKLYFLSTSSRYFVTDIYVGSDDPDLSKTFLSRPGSIVQEMGVELRLGTKVELIETPAVINIDSLPPLVSITAGLEPSRSYLKNFSTTWMSEELDEVKSRVKFVYEESYDPIISTLKIRWEENEEVRDYIERLRFKWESDPVQWYIEELTIWYEEELPEDRTLRDYLSFNWEQELTQGFNSVISSPYLIEGSFYTSRTLEVSWEEVLVDPIILQPYFVRLKEPETTNFIDCISFNVWGNPDIVSPLIENGGIRFLFSNPVKYELIMFDYNLNPYSEVFLSSLNEPVLDTKLSIIPDSYIKVGNYTIKDVNKYNSFSLDVINNDVQLNEYKSYWVPDNIESNPTGILLSDGSKAYPIKDTFRDDHHEDIVELDLVMLDSVECCFTQSSVGSRCSPY